MFSFILLPDHYIVFINSFLLFFHLIFSLCICYLYTTYSIYSSLFLFHTLISSFRCLTPSTYFLSYYLFLLFASPWILFPSLLSFLWLFILNHRQSVIAYYLFLQIFSETSILYSTLIIFSVVGNENYITKNMVSFYLLAITFALVLYWHVFPLFFFFPHLPPVILLFLYSFFCCHPFVPFFMFPWFAATLFLVLPLLPFLFLFLAFYICTMFCSSWSTTFLLFPVSFISPFYFSETGRLQEVYQYILFSSSLFNSLILVLLLLAPRSFTFVCFFLTWVWEKTKIKSCMLAYSIFVLPLFLSCFSSVTNNAFYFFRFPLLRFSILVYLKTSRIVKNMCLYILFSFCLSILILRLPRSAINSFLPLLAFSTSSFYFNVAIYEKIVDRVFSLSFPLVMF